MTGRSVHTEDRRSYRFRRTRAETCHALSVTQPRSVLRRAEASDAADVADVWLRSFAAALPSVPSAHNDDEVRAWIHRVVIGTLETWVAVADNSVVGMMALDETDIDQLYLDPQWRGRGIGDVFVAHAKFRDRLRSSEGALRYRTGVTALSLFRPTRRCNVAGAQ